MSAHIDFKQLIASGTAASSVEDLQRKGYRHVKILNESKIQELIDTAVSAVIDDRANILAQDLAEHLAKEKAEIIAREKLNELKTQYQQQAQQEFKRLMAQHQEALKIKQELAESRDTLQGELEGLRRELARQQEEFAAKQRECEALAAKQPEPEPAPEPTTPVPAPPASTESADRLAAIETEMKKLLERLDQAEAARREAQDRAAKLARRLTDAETEMESLNAASRQSTASPRLATASTQATAPVAPPATAGVADKLDAILENAKSTAARGISEDEFNARVEQFRHDLRDKELRIAGLERAIGAKQSAMTDKDKLIVQLETRCRETEARVLKARHEKEDELNRLTQTSQAQREMDERELQRLTEQIGSLEDTLKQRETRIETLYQEKEETKKRLAELERDIKLGNVHAAEGDSRGESIRQLLAEENHIQTEINRLWQDFQGKDEAIKPLIARRKDAETHRARIADPNDPALSRLREAGLALNAAVHGLEEERDKIGRVIKNYRIRLGELRSERETLEAQVKRNFQYLFDDLRGRQTEREHQLVETETEKFKLEREVKNLRGRKQGLEGKYAFHQQREAALRRDLAKLEQTLESLNQEKAVLFEQKRDLEGDVERLQGDIAGARAELEKTRGHLRTEESQIGLALQLEEAKTLIHQLEARNRQLETQSAAAPATGETPATSTVPAASAAPITPIAPAPAAIFSGTLPVPPATLITVPAAATTPVAEPQAMPPPIAFPSAMPQTAMPLQPMDYPRYLPLPPYSGRLWPAMPLPRRDDKQTAQLGKENRDLKQRVEILSHHIQELERKIESMETGVPAGNIPDEKADPNLVIMIERRKDGKAKARE